MKKYLMIRMTLTLLMLSLSTIGCTLPSGQKVDKPKIDEEALAAGVESGPRTWIEFPPNGETLPLETINITVYAAGSGGVAQIDLLINGMPLKNNPGVPMGHQDTSTLARLDYAWDPPGPGEYTLEARSSSTSNIGSTSSIKFCIVSCLPESEAQFETDTTASSEMTDTATPAGLTPTGTPVTSTPTPTLTQTPKPGTTPVNIEFWGSPPYTNAGSCTSINWKVTGPVKSVTLDGAGVNYSGSKQVCPCQNTTYSLLVKKTDNTTESRKVEVLVSGTCAVPTTAAPPTNTSAPPTNTPIPPTDTPPPPADSSGPAVSGQYLIWESCKFYGAANISDPSGISRAKFFYNLNGEGWNSVWMQNVGGNTWQSEVGRSVDTGMGTPIGTVEYYIEATDTLNNTSQSGTSTHNYMSCSG